MVKQTAFFLEYLPINITLVSMKTANLPEYLGSTLRGVIGQALRQNPEAYLYLYDNRKLSENRQDIANPYIIVPPVIQNTTYHAGDELNFEFLLLGDATQYAQALINALSNRKNLELGVSRYPFTLSKASHGTQQRIIWQDGVFHSIAANNIVLPHRTLPNVRQLDLRTRTPLRIRRKGILLEKIDFPTIIRNIVSRMEAITMRYGGWVDKEEIERIQRLSTEVSTSQDNMELKMMDRYSNRQGKKIDFNGLMGTMQFEGEITPFVPWLFAAQTLHIGRNTTFGMGQIEVEFL